MTARGTKQTGTRTQSGTRAKKSLPAPRSATAVAQRLESLARAGVTHIPKSRGQTTGDGEAEKAALLSPLPSGKTPPPPPPKDGDSLELICREVAACKQCAELAETRTQTVFGVGNPSARLVFLGEAPGADEDKQGIPFVGRAGQLLTSNSRWALGHCKKASFWYWLS